MRIKTYSVAYAFATSTFSQELGCYETGGHFVKRSRNLKTGKIIKPVIHSGPFSKETAVEIAQRLNNEVDSNRLYNCCTGGIAPDWSKYDALELGGCITEKDHDSTIGGIERDAAEFFTIYAHIPNQGVEAITDAPTFEHAQSIMAELEAISGLKGSIHC